MTARVPILTTSQIYTPASVGCLFSGALPAMSHTGSLPSRRGSIRSSPSTVSSITTSFPCSMLPPPGPLLRPTTCRGWSQDYYLKCPHRTHLLFLTCLIICRDHDGKGGNPFPKDTSGFIRESEQVVAEEIHKQAGPISGLHLPLHQGNGVPPAEADIQRYFRVSPPSVHQMILTLEKEGLISRVPRQPRSVRVLLPSWDLPPLE